jgi:hypothetical protein
MRERNREEGNGNMKGGDQQFEPVAERLMKTAK